MKRFLKTNRLLLILLAMTVAVSLAVVAQRWQTERRNKVYDVVMDYNELELLAEQSPENVSWWLEQFRDMGITKVGLTEESLASLMENSPMAVNAVMMDAVIQDADWRSSYPEAFVERIQSFGFDRYDVLVELAGQEAMDFVLTAVEQRFHPEELVIYREEEKAYVLIDGTVKDSLYQNNAGYLDTFGKGFNQRKVIAASKVMYVSLGLMPEKVRIIQSLGMEVEPRTICYNGHNDGRFAQAVIAGYESYGITPTYIIAGGEAVIGYDDSDLAQTYFQDNNITLGLIETNVQRENIMQSGVDAIAMGTGYNAVRVFSVWDYIQYRYGYYGYEGAEEVENTLFRAIVERNIRVIYFKPVKETDDQAAYITDVEVYRDLFQGLEQRLAAHGIHPGRASVMEDIRVPSLALLAMGLGAGLCGVLLLDTFLPMKKKWTLVLAGVVSVGVAGAWLIMPNSFRLIASFANAVVFVCLAAAYFLQYAKQSARALPRNAPLGRIFLRALGALLPAVLIALVGAMMTAAPLSETSFMLEMGIFRGVKLAQLIPLAFFCVLFLSYYGFFEQEREGDTLQVRDIMTVMQWSIPVWCLLLLGVVAIVGYYYLARTGHESTVAVSSLELMIRNDLENLLLARPRTKEFLVAFPCIVLAVYCAVRRMPFGTALFGLVGTIGLTSVCNTFMHIRTPLYLGFVRTGYSLVFGLALGFVYTVCFDLFCRLVRRFLKK